MVTMGHARLCRRHLSLSLSGGRDDTAGRAAPCNNGSSVHEQRDASASGATSDVAGISGIGGQNSSTSSGADRAREEKPKSMVRRVLGACLSLALILFIFIGVIPQFANYQQAWTAIQNMAPRWWIAILIAATVNQISFVWPYQAVFEHLRFRHGFLETQTTTAISNTVPAGGAVAIGMTFRMFSSFGFTNVPISTAVVATGIWNLAFKFGLPIVAVILLVVTGQSTGGAVPAAIVGIVVIVVSGVVLWLTFRSEASAHRVGHLGDRVTNWLLHFFHGAPSDRLERSLLHFRDQTNDVVHRRGWLLTWTVLASQIAVFVLVFCCVRACAIPASQVSFLEVLLSFAVARLAGAIPVTPGGLGTVDAAFIGMLTAFGANSSDALAADLVWRATTYFPPIFIGIGTYLVWKRGMVRGRYTKTPDVSPTLAQS
jgi:uncharacterized protein (TIRG00374 family)